MTDIRSNNNLEKGEYLNYPELRSYHKDPHNYPYGITRNLQFFAKPKFSYDDLWWLNMPSSSKG